MKLVIGITGSTGVIYGIRLLEVLKEKGIETNLVMSEWAKKCVPMENPRWQNFAEKSVAVPKRIVLERFLGIVFLSAHLRSKI